MSDIDVELTTRAAAPGSMRYFAWLYSPAEQREPLVALLTVEMEIVGSATQAAHEVAHTRLLWWQEEISRLGQRRAQHPATRALQDFGVVDVVPLGELLIAAQMDLARASFENAGEVDVYFERRAAFWQSLLDNDADARSAALRLGRFIRRVEALRDTRLDAREGRVYWALDELEQRRVKVEDLREVRTTDATRELIRSRVDDLRAEWRELRAVRAWRGLIVLASLHARLLRHFERADYNVLSRRHELGPVEKVWTAWRAARRASR